MSGLISLCIIAKNEEANIGRCIKSALPFVDQVIVVDTGSTDNTVNIAKELGAEVYSVPWQEDFSCARNDSLKHAAGQWILFLDCDEELDGNSACTLRETLEKSSLEGYWLRIVNMINNQPNTSFLGFRMFRNNPNYRFECPIHEQVLPSVVKHSSLDKIGQLELTVYHYGYDTDEATTKQKIKRNLELLNKALDNYGEYGFVYFYLGVEYQKLGEYQKALDYYSISLEKTNLKESYAPAMVRSMVYCNISLKRLDEGIQLCEKYEKIYPEYTDLTFLKGVLYFHQGWLAESLECMNRCLAMGPPPDRYLSSRGIAVEKPLSYITKITDTLIKQSEDFIKQGNRVNAYTSLNLAYQELTKHPDEKLFEDLLEKQQLLLSSAENYSLVNHVKSH